MTLQTPKTAMAQTAHTSSSQHSQHKRPRREARRSVRMLGRHTSSVLERTRHWEDSHRRAISTPAQPLQRSQAMDIPDSSRLRNPRMACPSSLRTVTRMLNRHSLLMDSLSMARHSRAGTSHHSRTILLKELKA
jgi:hypothetical protein